MEACPEGIDVYFDNVGGEALESALLLLRQRARVVLCGAISQYNSFNAEGAADIVGSFGKSRIAPGKWVGRELGVPPWSLFLSKNYRDNHQLRNHPHHHFGSQLGPWSEFRRGGNSDHGLSFLLSTDLQCF